MAQLSRHSGEHQDLDAQLDYAFAFLDQLLDMEEGLEEEPMPNTTKYERSGLLHRFKSDDAIHQFCMDNYLDDPETSSSGRVTAYCSYTDERVHIGWTD